MIKRKIREWARRYLMIELIAMLFSVLMANLSILLSRNIIVSAFIGTWSDNIVYYILISYKDLKARKRKDGKLSFISYFKVLRNLILEFGPAEYLDSFIIRPFYLMIMPFLIHNYSLAIFIGLILANITFYIPTIISYEARKIILKD